MGISMENNSARIKYSMWDQMRLDTTHQSCRQGHKKS